MTIERIRGRRLQQLRARLLREQPLCRMCAAQGRVRAATVLDHVVALVNGGGNEDENLQGLCRECHELKTRTDLGHEPSAACDVDGIPLDPRHHWRTA